MNLPIFALFNRALRLESRSGRSYFMRLLVLAMLFLALLRCWGESGDRSGISLFMAIAQINFVVITLAGSFFFSTAITEEKEEKTLLLMNLTGLNSFTVLFGKSVSRLVSMTQLLLLQLPFVMLAVALGGVSKGIIFMLFFALLTYAVLINGIALFCSVFFDTNKHAVIGTVVLTIFYLAFTGATGSTSSIFFQSPLLYISEFGSVNYSAGIEFSQLLFPIILFVYGIVLSLFSWFLFDMVPLSGITKRELKKMDKEVNRNNKGEKPAKESSENVLRGLKKWLRGGRPWRKGYFWKDFNFICGGLEWIAVKFIIVSFFLGLILPESHDLLLGNEPYSPLVKLVIFFTGFEILMRLFIVVSKESKLGLLHGLVMLPISIGRLLIVKIVTVFISIIPNLLFMAGLLFYEYYSWLDSNHTNMFKYYSWRRFIVIDDISWLVIALEAMVFVLICYYVIYLSLTKRKILFIAITLVLSFILVLGFRVILYFVSWELDMLISLKSSQIIICAIFSVMLHFSIVKKIEILASE